MPEQQPQDSELDGLRIKDNYFIDNGLRRILVACKNGGLSIDDGFAALLRREERVKAEARLEEVELFRGEYTYMSLMDRKAELKAQLGQEQSWEDKLTPSERDAVSRDKL